MVDGCRGWLPCYRRSRPASASSQACDPTGHDAVKWKWVCRQLHPCSWACQASRHDAVECKWVCRQSAPRCAGHERPSASASAPHQNPSACWVAPLEDPATSELERSRLGGHLQDPLRSLAELWVISKPRPGTASARLPLLQPGRRHPFSSDACRDCSIKQIATPPQQATNLAQLGRALGHQLSLTVLHLPLGVTLQLGNATTELSLQAWDAGS